MIFGSLLKEFRLKSGFVHLSQLSQNLEMYGFFYDCTVLSRWQTGERVPTNRKLLIILVKIFVERNAIKNIQEANSFLESANQGYLTDKEKTFCFVEKSIE